MMFIRILRAELLKLKRSRITWILAVVYAFAPLMVGLMMSVLKDPELGRRMGLMTAKAQMTIGAADWPTYLTITAFLFAGGMIVLAIVDAFIFGREYAEGTAKNMLTLPIGRGNIVAAKLTVSALWFAAMAAIVYGEAMLVGFAIDLPGYSARAISANLGLVAGVALEAFLASSASAWIAVASRGFLAPVGFGVLLLLIGDFFAHTGWGPWVPWSIVLLSSGAGGAEAPLPGAASLLVLAGFFLAGGVATYLTMDRVDNTQ